MDLDCTRPCISRGEKDSRLTTGYKAIADRRMQVSCQTLPQTSNPGWRLSLFTAHDRLVCLMATQKSLVQGAYVPW